MIFVDDMKKHILVVGAFGYKQNQLDGQTVKTRNIYTLLKERYEGVVEAFDTLATRSNPMLLFHLVGQLIKCRTLLLLPAHNNWTYLFPVLYVLSKILRYEIVIVCIGGWQVEYFKGIDTKAHKLQMRLAKRVKVVLAEMNKVEQDLRTELGFDNTQVLYNFRHIDTTLQNTHQEATLRLVFMARINRKKGYETIFNLAQYIRDNLMNITIDFYGPITQEDKLHFMQLVEANKDIVTYKGVLQPHEIASTLVKYDIMLFPTQYYTEGLPGTIIDAYTASLPVIATQWKHATEFIDDGVTGYIVPFDNCQDAFNEAVCTLYNDRKLLAKMKLNAHNAVLRYTEDSTWKVLSNYI